MSSQNEQRKPQDVVAAPMTPEELQEFKQENLLNDDDYTTELRLQVAYYGEALLNRTKYEVEVLEHEFVALSGVFNEFLDEVKLLDAKIGELSTSINKGKMQAAKELDQTIKGEIQVIVDQLRLVPNADLESVEVLYQNLDALQDNYDVIQSQLKVLDEIGIKTDVVQKNLPALEKGIAQFSKTIEDRQLSLLVGDEEEDEESVDYDELKDELKTMIESQSRAMINHLRQTQMMANPQEVEFLKRNQEGFLKNVGEIARQLDQLENAGIEVEHLRTLLKPVESGLKQFERALASNQYLKFSEKIYEEVKVVQAQIREAHLVNNADDLEVLNENVDIMFDICDDIADEMDVMAEQGQDIEPLLEHYDVLRVNLEQFERAVQDAGNRIGLTSGQIS